MFNLNFNNFKKLRNFITQFVLQYLLLFIFLNLILSKINHILFNISYTYILIFNILIIIFFNKYIINFQNKIKETYIFNLFLYYYFLFKNKVYSFLFQMINFFNSSCNQKERKFFILSFCFNAITYSYFIFIYFISLFKFNLFFKSLLLIILLIFNIYNLIENRIISKELEKDTNIITNSDFDFAQVQKLLFIKNPKFNKNISLFYIQKRHASFGRKEFLKFLKENTQSFFQGLTIGGVMVLGLQISTNQIEKQKASTEEKKASTEEKKAFTEEKKVQYDEESSRYQHQKDFYLFKLENLNKEIDFLKKQAKNSPFYSKINNNSKIYELSEKKKEIENNYEDLNKIFNKNLILSINKKKETSIINSNKSNNEDILNSLDDL